MLKVTEIISKYIISLFDGQTNGEVESVLFDVDAKKAKFISIYDNASNLTLILPTSKIFKIGDSAITIKNSTALQQEYDVLKQLETHYNPMNAKCFSIDGNLIGSVTDIVLNNKLNIESLILNNNKVILAKDIANFNNNTMIIYNGSKVNIKAFCAKCNIEKPAISIQENRYVKIMEIVEPDTQAENNNEKEIEPVAIGPTRVITNYKFLINRKVSKNILSFNGEIIIKENSKINTNIIDVARCNGKLKELTMYSF